MTISPLLIPADLFSSESSQLTPHKMSIEELQTAELALRIRELSIPKATPAQGALLKILSLQTQLGKGQDAGKIVKDAEAIFNRAVYDLSFTSENESVKAVAQKYKAECKEALTAMKAQIKRV